MAKGSYIGQVTIGDNTYPIGSLLYGTCAVAANVAAKTVNDNNLTTATFTDDNLASGVTIHVKFTNSNTASSPTLKVGDATPKPILQFGTTVAGTTAATSWRAGAIVTFTYDSTYNSNSGGWFINSGIDNNSTYTAATAAPGNIAASSSTGTSTNYARQDHTHGITVATGTNAGQVKIAGQDVSVNGWANKANLASPTFTGTPAAPTAAAGTNTTQIATTAFVATAISNSFAANDAMQFKGTIAGGSTGAYGALTPAANTGDTYKVSTAGQINGITVEVGDMLICTADNTAAATSSNYSTIAENWIVVQTNIDGAVIGPASSTENHFALFDGTTGKIIKDSGVTLNTSSGSTTKWLTEKGTWTTPTAANVGAATSDHTQAVNKGGTNLNSYTIGDIIYASGATALSQLNGNTTTTRKFLTSVAATSGTAAAPSWTEVTKTDVGLSNVENTALSTWTGSTYINTLGTITTGTWQGTEIAASYIGNHSASKITSGTLGIARGGTGKGTIAAYSIWYASAKDTLAELAANTTATKKFITMTGTGSAGAAPTWGTVSASDVGLGNVTNDAQIPKSIGTAKGDIIYWTASATPARLGIGTTNQILKATADGPAWSTFSAGSLPTLTGNDFTASVSSNGTLTLTASTRSFSQGTLPSFS